MRTTFVFVLVLVCVLEGLCNVHGPPECKLKAKQIMKKVMKVQLQCSRDMMLHDKTYEEYMKHVECLSKCALLKAGFIHDETAKVTEDTVRKAVIEKVHPEYKDKAEQTVIKCLQDHKAHDLDPADPACAGYRDVKQCIIDATADICGVAPIF
ncbi:unnamed protein product [Allacma fusca]|uniref:Uncharacterized protein n=1 Tax=Allacma fusca TaxID=39272 RepID=A0A8J2L5V3_9HEXA|nr:unnamed protein product [Allacma fusca]